MISFILIAAGVISVLYGVIVMLTWSGTSFFAVWYVMGALAIGTGVAMRMGLWQRLPSLCRRAAGIIVVVALAAVVGLSTFFMHVARQSDPATAPDDLDYLVVLGAQVYADYTPSEVLRFRLDAAITYLRTHPTCKVVVSGGQGPNEPTSEGPCMAEYLERQGISADRVITEDASLNTQENILFSLQKIDADTGGRGTEQHVGIVTNNFHVFRAMSIARHLGMEHAVGISGDVDPVYLPNNLLRECLGIAKDTLTGNM